MSEESHAARLRRERERLVARSAWQRGEICDISAHLQKSFRWVDFGFAVGRALRVHPLLAVATSSVLLRTSKTKRLLSMGRLVTAWELVNLVRKYLPRRRFK